MGDTDDINEIFRIVDSDGSGYLNKEKLQCICPYLSPSEIDIIFNDLDTDHDNRISLKEFTHGFKEVIEPRDRRNLLNDKELINYENSLDKKEDSPTNIGQIQINEVFYNLSCQEQIYDFYETLRNGSSGSIEQFQSILEVFVCDIIKYRKEIKRLEDSYKREKEMNEQYLRRIEEEQEREMHQFEEKIRKEEKQKFESERELIQQRASNTISDLQANLQRLQTIEQCYLERQSSEDSSIVLLREEISKLTQENQTLNLSLNDSLTTIAILESDLQSLKTQLNERQTMLLQYEDTIHEFKRNILFREKRTSSNNHLEKESLQANIRQLVEVNKKLRDENDTLRAMIESNKSDVTSSDIPLTSKRSMSRRGSVLETYWNNHHPKIECALLSNLPTTQQQSHLKTFDSFDLESNDEQDSGLSLTTIRDATEVESDNDVKLNKQILKTSKQYRSVSNKRNNDDTASTDVFDEKPMDRNNSKRWSQQRSSKCTSTGGHASSKYLLDQSLARNPSVARKPSGSMTTDTKREQIVSSRPFDRMYKVVFCGDAAVGKSTLIMRLCKGKFVSNINSTLGVDFQNKQLELDGKCIAIQLWDTAGQERFRSIAKSYFRRCDGVILVYDSTYERSFLNVREWIDTITESTSKRVSVMIAANKIDLRDQMRADGKRIVEHDDGAKLAKEYQALFIETSAKDGTNSNETLIELARDMQCNEDLERYRTSGIDLDKTTKKATCCGSRS